MKQKTYYEKLKDPRWQKKRLKILERDEFVCRSCGIEDKTLHVHHLAYRKNTNPWDYEEDELVTLCEDCHKEITEYTDHCIGWVRMGGFSVDVMKEYTKVISELYRLNPYELVRIYKILKVLSDV